MHSSKPIPRPLLYLLAVHLLQLSAIHIAAHQLAFISFQFAMAKSSSSRSSTVGAAAASPAMRVALVLMLLLGTVLSAHGRPVLCTNLCAKAVVVNGVEVAASAEVTVEMNDVVEIKVVNAANVELFGSYSCPPDVTALLVVYEEGCVKVKVAAVSIISKLLHTVVGLVLGLIKCLL